jgi:hypothetical protein
MENTLFANRSLDRNTVELYAVSGLLFNGGALLYDDESI